MPATCRFCLTDNLPDSALKCRACGSWLDPARDTAASDGLRLALQQELRGDLKEHRAYLEALLSQLKYVAALVVAAGLAATVYFGFRTDRSIVDTAAQISKGAEAEIKAATAEVTEATRKGVVTAVQAKMASPETAALIERVIAESVASETEARLAAVSADIDARISAAVGQLDGVSAEIAAVKDRSQKALAELAPIEASYSRARSQTVAGSQSILPVQPVVVEEKGGLHQLAELLRRPVEALRFAAGNYYEGPVVWAYVDRLRTRPAFRHVLILDRDDRFVGMFDAAALAAVLDPPDAENQRRRFEGELAFTQLPSPDQVQGWTEFADAMTSGDLARVTGLAGFVPLADAVVADWTSVQALDHMERLGRDRLPVGMAPGHLWA